jgi:DNA repair exonuclease SbcCD ATPase subunit
VDKPDDFIVTHREVEQLRGQLALLEQEYKDQKGQKDTASLRKLFQDFRSYILVPYFKGIEHLVSLFLQEMTPYHSFQLTDGYDIEVDGEPLESYSGGQVDLICTFFRIGVSRALAELRFGRIPFIILDSFADSLDDVNYELVVRFLETHASEFNQVIATSHREIDIPGATRVYL